MRGMVAEDRQALQAQGRDQATSGAPRSWRASRRPPTQDGGTSSRSGTRAGRASSFPIFGKTGTAERIGQADQSWYVAYSYDHTPERKPILVVVTVEKGGFGAESAAPAARLILSKWFGVDPKLIRGSSQDT